MYLMAFGIAWLYLYIYTYHIIYIYILCMYISMYVPYIKKSTTQLAEMTESDLHQSSTCNLGQWFWSPRIWALSKNDIWSMSFHEVHDLSSLFLFCRSSKFPNKFQNNSNSKYQKRTSIKPKKQIWQHSPSCKKTKLHWRILRGVFSELCESPLARGYIPKKEPLIGSLILKKDSLSFN